MEMETGRENGNAIEKIKDGDLTLAIVLRGAWKEGLNFVSSEEDFQQVGTWVYKKGYRTKPHIHLVEPRQVLRTQEVVFVRDGRVRVDIYTEREEFLKSVELGEGDAVIVLGGGHSYEILEDGTRVLEIKNGPYLGPDRDRKRF